jgi:hypothetical protein
VARWQGRRVHAFTRTGDAAARALALLHGCVSAQGSEQAPPEPLDTAILFAPVGSLVRIALKAVRPGGIVVCAGIHMSDIPSFPYELLWVGTEGWRKDDGRDFPARQSQRRSRSLALRRGQRHGCAGDVGWSS